MSFKQRLGEWAQRVREPEPRPRFHGDDPDPRYPSPRELRTLFSWILDVALNVGAVFAVLHLMQSSGQDGLLLLPALPLAYLVTAFTNRVLVQRVLHASLGKILVGLVVIRRDNGGWVPLGNLTSAFFLRGLALLLDAGGAEDESDHLSVVRRRDVKALRANGTHKPLISPADTRPLPGQQPPHLGQPYPQQPPHANPPGGYQPQYPSQPNNQPPQQYPRQYPPPAANNRPPQPYPPQRPPRPY
ncbi:hypothetical protein AB0H76_36310 [Nocardia sp. NPDC050712]|uniref:hypothetical protein n=1 Tax=Nocardia sp. NPDC050712 TaxID=3155518 RepID=UPI0033DA41C1